MEFNDWWEQYVTASGGEDCRVSDITGALQRPEPWLNEKLENFVARAEALLEALNKEGGKKALFAELEKTSKGIDQVLQLLWAQQNLLTVIRRTPEKLPSMSLAEEETEEGPHLSWNSARPKLEDLLTVGLEPFT